MVTCERMKDKITKTEKYLGVLTILLLPFVALAILHDFCTFCHMYALYFLCETQLITVITKQAIFLHEYMFFYSKWSCSGLHCVPGRAPTA